MMQKRNNAYYNKYTMRYVECITDTKLVVTFKKYTVPIVIRMQQKVKRNFLYEKFKFDLILERKRLNKFRQMELSFFYCFYSLVLFSLVSGEKKNCLLFLVFNNLCAAQCVLSKKPGQKAKYEFVLNAKEIVKDIHKRMNRNN